MLKPDENVATSDHVIVAQAGEALAARDAVYISPADGKAYKCDATDLSKIGFVGFTQEALAINATAYIVSHNIMGGWSGLTVGAMYFLSTTPGLITTTRPTNFKIVAEAISTTVLKIYTEPTKRIRTYTTVGATTWTKPAGLKYIEIEVQGGGGGGSGVPGNTYGNQGAAGGYSFKRILAADLAATETVTVGAAGTGGAAGSNNGTAGGNSSFGSHATANGGQGGQSGGAAGGTATGGDINVQGEAGGQGTSNGGTAGGLVTGGGGNSRFGAGARPKTGGSAGESATGYGAGGGAGSSVNSSTFAGSDGTQGIVIVTEYY